VKTKWLPPRCLLVCKVWGSQQQHKKQTNKQTKWRLIMQQQQN
jgi:hypothetical protein